MRSPLVFVLFLCALVEWIMGEGKEELSDRDRNHLQAKIDLLVKEILGLKTKLRSITSSIHGLENDFHAAQADIKSIKPSLHSNTVHVKDLLDNVHSNVKQIKDMNTHVHTNSDGIKGLRASITSLEAGIASSRESLVSYPTSELVWQSQQIIGEQKKITKGKLITTLGTVDQEYKFTFDFNGPKTGNYGNIIHMTIGGDDISKYGDWIPCVYYNGGMLEISSAVNGNPYFYKTAAISPNDWHNIEIGQQKVGKQFYYSITVDGRRVTRVVNNKTETFHDVKVFVSDPWYTPQTGFVRNLNFHSTAKKVNQAKSYYTEYKALFVGFGYSTSSSYHEQQNSQHTLEECLLVCYTKHEMEKRWNGVRYATMSSECYCIKDNQGHITSKSDLHYKFMNN